MKTEGKFPEVSGANVLIEDLVENPLVTPSGTDDAAFANLETDILKKLSRSKWRGCFIGFDR